jgi:hypothetical protein
MRSGEAGFSLIEVLVAFTVLTAAVIAGFQIFGDGLGRIGRAASQVALIEGAEASLATFTAIKPGRYDVITAHGRALQIVVSPVVGDPEPWAIHRPFHVEVWADRERLLSTIVMGAPVP